MIFLIRSNQRTHASVLDTQEARLERARAAIERARSGPMTFTQTACG